MYQIIKKPLITEKNTVLAAAGTYAFEVTKEATKTEIKKAVEKLFEVKVDSVKTMICRDRARRTGTRVSKIKHWKKALVKLKNGEKIALFEGV